VIEIGRYNTLRILRQTPDGLCLADGDGQQVLLPRAVWPEGFRPGQDITVFVYRDAQGRKTATDRSPAIKLHEFGFLPVTAVTDAGAFMDWGLGGALFVPSAEQDRRMKKGGRYVVYLDLDTKTDRLFASGRIERHLRNDVLTVREKEEVRLLVYQKTDLGFSVIVNDRHGGMIYNNEIFRIIRIGDQLTGYVKKIREDRKIDLTIQPVGYKNVIDSDSERVFHAVEKAGGVLAVTDKSSPGEIHARFGISKKAFKKAAGALYRQRRIIILPAGISLPEPKTAGPASSGKQPQSQPGHTHEQ